MVQLIKIAQNAVIRKVNMIGSIRKKPRNAVNIENARTKTDYFTQKLGEADNDIKETWKY